MTDVMPAQTASERIDMLRRKMDLEAGMPDLADSSDVRASIQAKVLDSQTDDDVLESANAGLTSAESMANVPIRILNYRFNRSTMQDSDLPVYAVIDAVDHEGVSFTIGCGAETVLTQLWRLSEIKPFASRPDGFLCAFTEKTTASGNTVRSLRKLTPAEAKLFS